VETDVGQDIPQAIGSGGRRSRKRKDCRELMIAGIDFEAGCDSNHQSWIMGILAIINFFAVLAILAILPAAWQFSVI
jgi:hypothetical protein